MFCDLMDSIYYLIWCVLTMISVQKLAANLKQSQTWETTFRQEIKHFLEEITLKNQQICLLTKDNAAKRSQLEKRQAQLKHTNQQKQKVVYKTDKIRIKVEEVENRLRVYEQSGRKKEDWRKELVGRVKALEKCIRRESRQDDQIDQESLDDNQSLSNFSCHSVSAHSQTSDNKHPASRPYSQAANADANLIRVKELERQYLKQLARCKQTNSKIEMALQKEQRLKQLLKEMGLKDHAQNKENRQSSEQNRTAKDHKQSIEGLKDRIVELQRQSKQFNGKITAKHALIEEYAETLHKMVAHDAQYVGITKQVSTLERQVKKQRNAMLNIGNYLLKQSNAV